MSVWSNSDSANAAPIFPGVAGVDNATGSQMFGNTQIAAFNTGLRETTGIFGVDVTEQTVSMSSNTHPQHAGWVLVTRGTGPIISVTANTSSVTTNGSLILTGGGTGAVQANVYVSVNAQGYVVNSAIQIIEGRRVKIMITAFFDSKNGIGYEGLRQLYELISNK